MAVDVDMTDKDDLAEHLPYATKNRLVLVTFDRPFAGRAMKFTDHAGVVCLPGPQDDVGSIVRLLTIFAEQHSPEEITGQVFWL